MDDLERQWTEAEAQQVTNQFSQVDSKLFEGQAGRRGLAGQDQRASRPPGAGPAGRAGPGGPQTAGGRTLTVIPATVSVEVRPARAEDRMESAFQRILRVSQRLAGEDKRADLTELTVLGALTRLAARC